MTKIKICGLKDPENLNTAITSGARFVGFVFYPPSPRFIELDTAHTLARMVPTSVRSVGLFVNPTDEQLDTIATGIQLDMIQLHGDETPERVAEIKSKYLMPVIKAVRVQDKTDLENLEAIQSIADWILFDAKPPQPEYGGTGKTFDWTLLQSVTMTRPWMLSGGLNGNNIENAISLLNPPAIDVSSGVESAKGVKSAPLIKSFINKVKSIS